MQVACILHVHSECIDIASMVANGCDTNYVSLYIYHMHYI